MRKVVGVKKAGLLLLGESELVDASFEEGDVCPEVRVVDVYVEVLLVLGVRKQQAFVDAYAGLDHVVLYDVISLGAT